MSRRPIAAAVAGAALLAAAATTARAQESALTPMQPFHQTAAMNLLGMPFGLFSGEFERALNPAVTLGLGGSVYTGSGIGIRNSLEGKVLYYPNEVALRGFAVGLTAGVITDRNDPDEGIFSDGFRSVTSATAPTVGVTLDYNWLLGKRKRFLVGTAIGARRVLRRVDEYSPLLPIYADGRLVIGLAF